MTTKSTTTATRRSSRSVFPDDTRLDFPTLHAAKAGLRNIMRAEIVELKEPIARLDRELEAENPDNPV